MSYLSPNLKPAADYYPGQKCKDRATQHEGIAADSDNPYLADVQVFIVVSVIAFHDSRYPADDPKRLASTLPMLAGSGRPSS